MNVLTQRKKMRRATGDPLNLRLIFPYCDIADIKVDIDDVKKNDCQKAAKEFAKFFNEPHKTKIEGVKSFVALISFLDTEEVFRERVRMYRFKNPNRDIRCCSTTSQWVSGVIRTPFGGQKRH